VRYLLLALRVGLGGLFAVAAALKLRDPAGFAQEIANYQLVPAWAPYLAVALPAVELTAGLAVAAAPISWRRAGTVVLALLLVLFTIAVGAALARGVDVSCGCFGTGSGQVSGWIVARNLALLAVAGALLARDRSAPVVAPSAAR
jgi:hypothetical protein